jgi:hypothetical protein
MVAVDIEQKPAQISRVPPRGLGFPQVAGRKRLTAPMPEMRHASKVRDLVMFEDVAGAKVAEVREPVAWGMPMRKSHRRSAKHQPRNR